MNITLTKLYAVLCEKLDKETAENLSSYIEMKVETTVIKNTAHLATKDDLSNLRKELTQDINNVKSDMIKWVVGLFITITMLIIGLYLKK